MSEGKETNLKLFIQRNIDLIKKNCDYIDVIPKDDSFS